MSTVNKDTLVARAAALPDRAAALQVSPRHLVLGAAMQPPFPAGLTQITLGLGCFWGAERLFWQLPGVYTTAVG